MIEDAGVAAQFAAPAGHFVTPGELPEQQLWLDNL
jgi:hypothetical protein